MQTGETKFTHETQMSGRETATASEAQRRQFVSHPTYRPELPGDYRDSANPAPPPPHIQPFCDHDASEQSKPRQITEIFVVGSLIVVAAALGVKLYKYNK